MTSRHLRCDGAIAARCRLALLLFVSLAAALVTHFLIDVLGDVLLAHDTYDDVAHASRQTGALASGAFLLVTLGFAAVAALVAAFVTAVARVALRRLAALHHVIVAIAESFIRMAFALRSLPTFCRRTDRRIQRNRDIFGSNVGGRAPPGFPALVFL